MELVRSLRRARERRIAFAVGALLAVLVAAVAGRATGPERWTAATRLVLDTPVSQVIASAPKGADSLAWRAEILAALATTETARARLVDASGIPADELTVTDSPLSEPLLPATLPRRAALVANTTATPYTLTAQADGQLPFVTLVAEAPDRTSATRLLEAASAVVETAATAPDADRVQRLVVEQAGEVAVESHAAGSGARRGVLVGAAFLTLWWTAVLAIAALAGGRHARRSAAPDALAVAPRSR